MVRRFCRECNGIIEYPKIGKFYCSSKCEEIYNTKIRDDDSFINWTMYKDYNRWAIERGIEFNITIEDMKSVYNRQQHKCAISGLDLYFRPIKIASLDRINNSGNYDVDNIQWVHKDINKMRNSYSMTYFLEMCKLIVEYNGLLNNE